MMKMQLKSILWTGLIAMSMMACESGGGKVENKTEYMVDHTDPVKVVQAVFDVAAGADPKILGGLCDPLGKNDGDTRRICELSSGFDNENEFVQYFRHAKIDGEARIEGSEAYVPFLFGPNGDREEEMRLVERDDHWYLMSF